MTQEEFDQNVCQAGGMDMGQVWAELGPGAMAACGAEWAMHVGAPCYCSLHTAGHRVGLPWYWPSRYARGGATGTDFLPSAQIASMLGVRLVPDHIVTVSDLLQASCLTGSWGGGELGQLMTGPCGAAIWSDPHFLQASFHMSVEVQHKLFSVLKALGYPDWAELGSSLTRSMCCPHDAAPSPS